MKRLLSVFGLLGFVLIMASLTNKKPCIEVSFPALSFNKLPLRKSAGPPSCYANEPATKVNCSESGCHDNFKLNSGSAAVTLNLGGTDSIYETGKTYTFTISVEKSGMKRAGFQFIALQNSDVNKSPGKITLSDVKRTQLLDKVNPHSGPCNEESKTWVEHTLSGCTSPSVGVNSWTFAWQAPETDVGPVTFYLASVEANDDLDCSGDYVYTLQKTVSGKVGIEPNTAHRHALSVYPNPSSNRLTIDVGENESPISISLYNIQGKCIKTYSMVDLYTIKGRIELLLPKTATGICFVKLQGKNYTDTQSIFIDK
jgi:hypothetical protein